MTITEFSSTAMPTDLEFAEIKSRLLAEIEELDTLPPVAHLVPTRSRTRRLGKRSIALVVAPAIAVALIVGTVTVGPGFGLFGHGASAQAASVLHTASKSAFAASDPVVAPGQYLKFTTVETATNSVADPQGRGNAGTYRQTQKWTVYQPATGAADWVLVRQTFAPFDVVGGKATHDIVDTYTPQPVQTTRGSDGDIPGWPTQEKAIQSLPRTTSAVLAYLYKAPAGGSWSKDQSAWEQATDMLSFDYVPADLRAVLYGALTEIPGVVVTQNQATIDGRTGVAIGFTASHNGADEIIIDPATGEYLGKRTNGKSDLTSVTVSVVNSAP